MKKKADSGHGYSKSIHHLSNSRHRQFRRRRWGVFLVILLLIAAGAAIYTLLQVHQGEDLWQVLRQLCAPLAFPLATLVISEIVLTVLDVVTTEKDPWSDTRLEDIVRRDLLRKGVLKPEIIGVQNFEALYDYRSGEPCKVITYDRRNSRLLFASHVFACGECGSVEIGSVPAILRTFREMLKASVNGDSISLRQLRRAFDEYVVELPNPINDDDLVGADFLWDEFAHSLSRGNGQSTNRGEIRVSL